MIEFPSQRKALGYLGGHDILELFKHILNGFGCLHFLGLLFYLEGGKESMALLLNSLRELKCREYFAFYNLPLHGDDTRFLVCIMHMLLV